MTTPAPDHFAAVGALPGVAPAVERVSAALDRLAGRRALRLDPGQVRTELSLRAARAGARLAGHSVDIAALRDGRIEDGPAADVVRAALRIFADLAGLAPAWSTPRARPWPACTRSRPPRTRTPRTWVDPHRSRPPTASTCWPGR